MDLLAIMKLTHDVGVAWGVGGATIGTIIMAHADKNLESAQHLMKVMPAISKLIWIAITLLVTSGIILTQSITDPINSSVLETKHIAVAFLILNGLNLTFRILPKMEKFAPKGQKPSLEFLSAKKSAKTASLIGLVLWYVILVLAVMI